jgi:hypothetical protein
MSVVQVFPSFMMLSLACVFVRDGLPSVEMRFHRCEDRCCGLSKVGILETVGFRQVMWFVMLETVKDRGVDTCHTRFLHQNQVLIVCMTQDQLFHTYGQKCSQITKYHK